MVTFAIMTEDAMRVKGPPQGHWTREDWEQQDHEAGIRYEIIEGFLYMSTSPSLMHQYTLKRLYALLGLPAENDGLGQAWFAPIGVFMPGSQPVQPDFVFVKSNRADILLDKHINGVPDLIVEILSPGNRAYDEETKFKAYQKAGVAEYGLIDPLGRDMTRYVLVGSAYEMAGHYYTDDIVNFSCLPTISFRLGALFDGAPDTTL
jgi:Uma2 family endonuclease